MSGMGFSLSGCAGSDSGADVVRVRAVADGAVLFETRGATPANVAPSGDDRLVAVCPTGCLAMAGLRPWMPRPRDCVSCRACELVCPADAIALREPS